MPEPRFSVASPRTSLGELTCSATPLDTLAGGRGLAQALLPLSKNPIPSPLSARPAFGSSFSGLLSQSYLARSPSHQLKRCLCVWAGSCSVLFFSRRLSKSWPHRGRVDVLSPFISVILTDSSTASPVHVLMLSTQAVRGLPCLRAPGIVPCIMSFIRQLPCFLMV